jgi:hypothetical protein
MTRLKQAWLALCVVALAGCNNPNPVIGYDQAVRRQVFAECLKNVPKGPQTTTYNDWAEVVDACESAAMYQSKVCISNCDKYGSPR